MVSLVICVVPFRTAAVRVVPLSVLFVVKFDSLEISVVVFTPVAVPYVGVVAAEVLELYVLLSALVVTSVVLLVSRTVAG